MFSRKSSALSLIAGCLLGTMAAAHAEGTAPAAGSAKVVTDSVPAANSPTKAVEPSPIVTDPTPPGRAEAPKEKPEIPADTQVKDPAASSSVVTPSTSVTSSAPQAAPADPTALLYAEKVAPGAFQEKRQLLLSSIKLAKKQNFGVTVYLGELNKVEEQIKQGNATPQLEARIDSIADGLQDQLKRSQILKTQRPTGGSPRTSYSGAGGTPEAAGHGHKNTDAIINELRQKYGDKIPAGLDNNELKEKFLNNPMAKEYLKKFTGQ
ncbi:MAG: hypothetical protein JST89_20230 [Cyanobacteria bacterium SZAS-4]|nr:hypothetical protein [Cyanobacteria bacterium SZAS-4]